jgi:hypothetical protein
MNHREENTYGVVNKFLITPERVHSLVTFFNLYLHRFKKQTSCFSLTDLTNS